MNILIPMAGAGSRFTKAGFVKPKPMIDVAGKPMIEWVLDNMDASVCNGHYICIVRNIHNQLYNIQQHLLSVKDNISIVDCKYLTEGACCTTLLAEDLINNETPLLIANSDQYLDWDWKTFLTKMEHEKSQGIDGCIICCHKPMELNDTKWSYAKVDEHGLCTDVREKQVISNNATVGLYYWSRGSDYVKYAKSMIEKNIRTNGEFYVAPVYNEAIQNGQKHTIYFCNNFHGLGVPQDLTRFETNVISKPRKSIRQATIEYVRAFNSKHIEGCTALMTPDFALTDPECSLVGKKNVAAYIQKIFESAGSLQFKAVGIFCDESNDTSVIEFELKLKDNILHGVDVIKWSKDPLMIEMRAYLY